MCAGVAQHDNDIVMMKCDGIVKWSVAVTVTHVHRRTEVEKVAHDLSVTLARCDVQRRSTVVILHAELCALTENQPNSIHFLTSNWLM